LAKAPRLTPAFVPLEAEVSPELLPPLRPPLLWLKPDRMLIFWLSTLPRMADPLAPPAVPPVPLQMGQTIEEKRND